MSASDVGHFAHPVKNMSVFGIDPGMTVADLGAGSGHYVLAMAKLLKSSGHVYAVDVQKDLLARIRTEAHKDGLKNVETVWGDLEEIGGSKIADDHVDLVLISNLLFQLEQREPPLAEARRILKRGGRLILIDWSESFGGMGPIKKHVLKMAEAQALAEKEGFHFLKSFAAGAHHYGLIFEKVA